MSLLASAAEAVTPLACFSVVHLRCALAGAIGNMIEGVYDMKMDAGNLWYGQLTYRKRVDGDIFIEFNASHQRWQIKPSTSRGTGKCIAEISVVSSKGSETAATNAQ